MAVLAATSSAKTGENLYDAIGPKFGAGQQPVSLSNRITWIAARGRSGMAHQAAVASACAAGTWLICLRRNRFSAASAPCGRSMSQMNVTRSQRSLIIVLTPSTMTNIMPDQLDRCDSNAAGPLEDVEFYSCGLHPSENNLQKGMVHI